MATPAGHANDRGQHAHRDHGRATETKVTTLELFFDLVFVFAVTQVTALLAADTSWLGAVRGVLVLAAIWWAWTAYAWLTNFASADRIGVRITLLAAMAAMLVASLTLPEAFGDAAPVFAISLFAVRVVQLGLFALTAETPELRAAVYKLAVGVLAGGLLLIAAAYWRGTAQVLLWGVALALDYAAPLIGGTRGWRVHPAHFAERHGLIVIIALGEAIISLGVGAAGLPIEAGLLAGAVAGLVCAVCLWWAYFDQSIAFAEHRLAELQGDARNRLARDSFSYLHLPIIAGIVMFALAAKKTLSHLHEPLHDSPLIALGLGPALVLVVLSILRKRHAGAHNRARLVAASLCLGTIAVGALVSSLAGLGAVAAVLTGLIVVEVAWNRRMKRKAAAAAAH